jgi:VWFA-related protein
MLRLQTLVFVFSGLVAVIGLLQLPPAPITSSTAAIVVDAVVRDGHGNPVTDLRKQDFQVFEDGILQEIGDLTVTVPGSPASSGRSGSVPNGLAPQSAALRDVGGFHKDATYVAIVFDRLTAEARPLAYRGAQACLENMQDDDFVAVYSVDLSLTTVQTYTNDRDKVRKALKIVASNATAQFDRMATKDDLHDRDDRGNPLPGDADAGVPVVASPESIGRPVDTRGEGYQAREILALNLRTHSAWEAMARDQQGYATTNALVAITSALGALPGRKTVVLFAEGLAIPPAVAPYFRSVITTANRGNVSVYTIDAGGLRVHSKDAETARALAAMGAVGIGGNGSLTMLELNEDLLRKDPRTSLTLLAAETGGFLVDNTNDLARAFRRIDSDRRFHYLLTYTPSNASFDGRWRRITVRVPSRRVEIRARSGYLAVQSPAGVPLLAYEGLALAALERAPGPTDLPLRARALVFPAATGSRVAVLAATDANALRFAQSATTTPIYQSDFTILAQIFDSDGHLVRKASQPYHLSGGLRELEQAQRGEILFFRQPTLAPGNYRLEVAVTDTLTGKSGVNRSPFSVPEATRSLQVSSLVVVQRVESLSPQDRHSNSNPLYSGDLLVYPNLGEPVRPSQENTLRFFAVVRVGRGAAPSALVQVLRGSVVLDETPLALSLPDGSGQVAQMGAVMVGHLPSGPYTLRLIVTQSDRREIRNADFELLK